MRTKKYLIGLAIGVLIFSVSTLETNAQSQYAAWRDRSDELPGMVSDGEMLLIAGGAVVVIGGLVAFLIIKKKQDKKLDAMLPDYSGITGTAMNATGREQGSSLGSLYNDISRAADQAPVLIFSRLDKIPNPGQGQNNVLSMGVLIKF